MASRHWALVVSGINLKAVHLDEGGGPAGSQVHTAIADDVKDGGALSNADGVVVCAGQQGDGVADADPLGALGKRAIQDLRRGAVGKLA